MKHIQSLKSGIAMSLVIGALTACTQTVVLYTPNPHLDPLPEAPAKAAPKADPDLGKQWHMAKMGLTKENLGNPMLNGNYNVRIALLSTGVDYNHEDLRGQVAINEAELVKTAAGDRAGANRIDEDKNGLVDDIVGYDVVDGDGLAYDRHGAGTAVAGLIAAKTNNGVGISGLMKEVQIYPIRYIDDNGQGSVANLSAALELAIKSRPAVVFIQNVTFRMGGQNHDPAVAEVEVALLKKYFDQLNNSKIPVVVGAGDGMTTFGNEGIEKLLKGYSNVVVVTSSAKDDSKALMANQSMSDVTIAAPGEKLYTTKPFNKYGEVSGTAFAAAEVTAAIALSRAMLGDRATMEKLLPVLISPKASDPVPSLSSFCRSGTRLNMMKYLNEVKSI